jgi:hypothetical protein
MSTMLKLLRRLVRDGAAPSRPLRPTAATSDVLARRTAPVSATRPKPGADHIEFDPYNTGAFDRGTSWERVTKRDY